ncbi:hypothetical protein D3C76_844300 [compost metagenome]
MRGGGPVTRAAGTDNAGAYFNIQLAALVSADIDVETSTVAADVFWQSGKTDRHAASLMVQSLVMKHHALFEHFRLGQRATQWPFLTTNFEHVEEVSTEPQFDR